MKTAIFLLVFFDFSVLRLLSAFRNILFRRRHGETLDYKIGDKLLFSYNYTTVYPAPGVDSVYKRSGFIHPLKTLGGEVMTNCSPADHYHHFGLWYAWTKTTFEGNEIDFWNLHKNKEQFASATSNTYPTTVLLRHWTMWSTPILPQKK